MPASDTGPFIVAVTGGIGCGKSTVAAIFERMGADVIDADLLAHQELAKEIVIEEVCLALGEGVRTSDGGLDHAAIASLVFADQEARRALEAIIHPRVRAAIDKVLAQIHQKGSDGRSPLPEHRPLVLLDIPLLETSSFRNTPHEVIFIDASRSDRLGRVRRTRNWQDEEFDRREAAQVSLEEKRRGASSVLDNPDSSDGLGGLEARCRQLVDSWTERLSRGIEPGK